VYESVVAGRSQLLLRRLDALVATPIPGTEGGLNPAFSPDGTRLAFTLASPRAIRVMTLPGGLVSTIADSLVDMGGVSWGRDGHVYYDGHLDGDGIARVREAGGRPEPVTRADSGSGELWHFRPHALPNGRSILFTIARGVVGGYRWFVGATEVGSERHTTLIEGRNPSYADGFLFYTTDAGTLMAVGFDEDRLTMEGDPVPVEQAVAGGALGRTDLAFSATGTMAYTSGSFDGGQSELTWVSRDGSLTRVDTTWRATMSQLAVSPDGRRVALRVSDGPDQSDIWVKDLVGGPPSRLSFGDAPINRAPSWSTDSREIVFMAAGSAQSAGVMRGPADGSALPHRIRPFPGGGSNAWLSPDEGWLVIEDGGGNVLAARTTGDTALIDLLRRPSLDGAPRVSPDGRWLAFLSDEGGQSQLYVTPFPDTRSAKRVISTESAVAVWWSPDGRELAYMTNGTDLIVAPVLKGAAFAVGERRVLFNVGTLRLNGLTYSHDGRRFLAAVLVGQGDAPDELILVENFMSEVRARVKR
jgi:serine/threonine-protein kinase